MRPYPQDINGPLPRADLGHLQCPLTPDPECIAIDDGLCCHSSSPIECATGGCTAHMTLGDDWVLGFGDLASRDNDYDPPVVCDHGAHTPFRTAMRDYVGAMQRTGQPDYKVQAYGFAVDEAYTPDNVRRLLAHHYNDVCPAWPFNEAPMG
jgi:hypothetical protein